MVEAEMNEDKLVLFEQLVNDYIVNAKNELEERVRLWKVDLTQRKMHEVVLALLAR